MNKSNRGEPLVLAATFLAAVGWLASKKVVALMPAAQFIGMRFLLASIILLPFCWNDLRRTTGRLLLSAISVGCVMALHLLLWVYAVITTDNLGEGAFIMSLAMLFAPLMGWFLYRQAPSLSFWFALPVAVSGMAFLSLSGGWHLAGSQLLFVASALMLSLHFNLNKTLAARLAPLTAVCIQLMTVGCISLLLFAVSDTTPSQMTTEGWLWFVAAAVFATSVRYFLQTAGQSRMDTGAASVLMIVEPLWTLLFSVLMLGEELPLSKIAGCLLIIFALLIYRLKEGKSTQGALDVRRSTL